MGYFAKSPGRAAFPTFKKELVELASQFSFEVDFERENTGLIRFKRDSIRVDVWQSGTVGIYEDGKQRFIKKVSREDLVEIFANPNVIL